MPYEKAHRLFLKIKMFRIKENKTICLKYDNNGIHVTWSINHDIICSGNTSSAIKKVKCICSLIKTLDVYKVHINNKTLISPALKCLDRYPCRTYEKASKLGCEKSEIQSTFKSYCKKIDNELTEAIINLFKNASGSSFNHQTFFCFSNNLLLIAKQITFISCQKFEIGDLPNYIDITKLLPSLEDSPSVRK